MKVGIGTAVGYALTPHLKESPVQRFTGVDINHLDVNVERDSHLAINKFAPDGFTGDICAKESCKLNFAN